MRKMITSVFCWAAITAAAQQTPAATAVDARTDESVHPGKTRLYTKEHPLVYEDAWDLWPYAFLNESGEPTGFNIDLIRLIMDELGIPYVIRLKPAAEAVSDLRNGKADLTFAVVAGHNEDDGTYSSDALTLFTQSVVTPKSKPLEIKNFRDLGKHRVIVNDSSLCHHMMIDYGWEDNAIPTEDMREAIQEVSNTEEGQIVWNTLSLKWLIRRYHIDNVELTPVNMPHGEYRFMSNDIQLLAQLDRAYARLYSADKLTPIQNKWFYPEVDANSLPRWVWYFTAIALTVLLVVGSYAVTYRIQARRVRRDNDRRNRRLALIIQTSKVRVWTYNVVTRLFTWHDDNGTPSSTYQQEEFAKRYPPEDFERLMQAIGSLAAGEERQPTGEPAAARGNRHDEEEVTLQVRARDTEDGDDEMRDFIITLSVLRRQKDGTPTTIIGTKKDITDELLRRRQAEEQSIRYHAAFNDSMVGILFFDSSGRLANINDAACRLYCCRHDEIVNSGVTLNDIFRTADMQPEEADGHYATQVVDYQRLAACGCGIQAIHRQTTLYNEYRLMTVRNEQDGLMGVFAICRDVSPLVDYTRRQKTAARRLATLNKANSSYEVAINSVLSESDMRLAIYSPDSHMLTVYRSANEVQHALTQTRCMTLVDERSQKTAMRMLADMDARHDHDFDTTLCTTLRTNQRRLWLQFCLTPRHGSHGEVLEYIGFLRDSSEQRFLEQTMETLTAKVQEVENTKNSFVKNMVQEIRQPMNTVVNYVRGLTPDAPSDDEPALRRGIMDNADRLLHLIDNILYLSRLEAHMVELRTQKCNFAEVFEAHCAAGWGRHRNNATRYIAENPYERMEVDIDSEHLGHVISQLTANAAKHTKSGTVRARYDYIGRRLMVSVDDTGEGIAPEELERINSLGTETTHTMKGLGLSICKEMLRQMNGTFEVSSEAGSGTTVYITVPCHATVIKRKRQNS